MRTLRNPPRPQRQRLQLQRRGLDKAPERHNADDDTHDVHDVVAVGLDVADAAPLYAAVFLARGCAREGRGVGQERAAEFGGQDVVWPGRCAGCFCEEVDEFEDEEAREGAAEIGDTWGLLEG